VCTEVCRTGGGGWGEEDDVLYIGRVKWKEGEEGSVGSGRWVFVLCFGEEFEVFV